MRTTGHRMGVFAAMLLAGWAAAGEGPSTSPGVNDPEARFRGTPAYDFGVTNVRWEAATPEYSYVTFDLYWSFSWRAKWMEPAATSCTGKDMELESWDAAWVFVKFLPDKDSREAQERNHWLHATLDRNPASHAMPAGAMNSVKLSDDPAFSGAGPLAFSGAGPLASSGAGPLASSGAGPLASSGAGGSRGMGVFIYRDAVGHGTNDWKNIKLRWLHPPASRPQESRDSGAAGGAPFDPAKAGVRVFAIPMVYVPQGPFNIGSCGPSGISRFPDGFTLPSVQMDHMPDPKDIGCLTDGSWRGGPVVPFLADAEWNGPAAEGSRARRIGASARQLWTTLSYVETGVGGSNIGDPGVLGDEYPTGYESFYCMKYDVTQGQYVDYLNSLPPDVAAGRSCLGSEVRSDYPMPGGAWRGGLTITVSGWPKAPGEVEEVRPPPKKIEDSDKRPGLLDLADEMLAEADRAETARAAAERAAAENKGKEAAQAPAAIKLPPVYSAVLPFRSCSGISRSDMYAYAIWTGMRPMSELEYEKAWHGAQNLLPQANTTDTNRVGRADVTKDMVNIGQPSEGFRRGNHAGGYGEPLTVFRVGCFATPTSDRVAANATYWGILEFGGSAVSALRRDFRGTHGDGTSSTGKPDAPLHRHNAPCTAPEDWPKRIGSRGGSSRTWVSSEYIDGRFVWNRARLVISAENRERKAAPKKEAVNTPASAGAARSASPVESRSRQNPSIKVSNVKWEPGTKDYSTISFDLAWDNSWRAKWEEPAEKNVTGRPLRLESRDAAWVFLKFRTAGTNVFSHGMLSPNAADHRIPADAALDVGLSEAPAGSGAGGTNGVGVFIYRNAVGSGANDFKGVKLRWLHPPSAFAKEATADKTPRLEGSPDSGVTSPAASGPKKSRERDPSQPPTAFDRDDADEPAPVASKAPAGKASASAPKAPAGKAPAAVPAVAPAVVVPPFEPGKADVKVHAIEMVYVPEGAFQSKVPWEQSLTTIRSATATEEWGCRDMNNPPANVGYPNGYNAFYCAKYGISQGEYADYLNSLGPARAAADYPGAYGINRFTIRCDTNTGVFKADVPDRPCNFLRWSRILSYEAWAGLRPLTDLEYEKACRGPRAVPRREDAWAEGLCAPAAGLGKELVPALPEIDAGASYWGIRGLSLSGCVHEWPGIISTYNGNGYLGTHGDGSPTPPPDWPEGPSLGRYGDKNMAYGAVWLTPANLMRTLALGEFLLFDNSGRYGARPVRTAPVRKDETSALQFDAVPSLQGYDVGIFWLTGRFHNLGDAPVKVEIVTPLPDACFVDGVAARGFTAAPKADTPFRILVAVTRMNAVKAMQGDNVLPVQIRAVGGEVLAEQTVKLTVDKIAVRPPRIRAFDGGTIEARLLNAADRPLPVSIVLDPSPECKPAETERRVEIAAGKEAVVTYPVPRQPLPTEGLRGMPFHVTVGQGVAQGGELAVNLLNQSRWWLGRKIVGGRPEGGGRSERGEEPQPAQASPGSEDKAPDGLPDGFFAMAERPRRWKCVEAGVTNLPINEAGSIPSPGSSLLAGAKLFAPAEREVKVRISPEIAKSERLRLWVNESVVYDSRAAGAGDKAFVLRPGMNTVAASWRSDKDSIDGAAAVSLLFVDGKTGQALTDLILDIEGK